MNPQKQQLKKYLDYIQLLNGHQISFTKNWKQINESDDTREVCQQNLVLVFSVNDWNYGIKCWTANKTIRVNLTKTYPGHTKILVFCIKIWPISGPLCFMILITVIE